MTCSHASHRELRERSALEHAAERDTAHAAAVAATQEAADVASDTVSSATADEITATSCFVDCSDCFALPSPLPLVVSAQGARHCPLIHWHVILVPKPAMHSTGMIHTVWDAFCTSAEVPAQSGICTPPLEGFFCQIQSRLGPDFYANCIWWTKHLDLAEDSTPCTDMTQQ